MQSLDADMSDLEEAMRLFFQFMKRPQHWARVVAHAGVNLDRPSTIILHSLAHQSCRVQDLASQLGVEAPSITRKTQELEAMGLLRRVPNSNDRRAIDLKITSSGKALVDRLWNSQRLPMIQVLEKWPAQDRKQLIALFSRFSQELAEPNYPTSKQKGMKL